MTSVPRGRFCRALQPLVVLNIVVVLVFVACTDETGSQHESPHGDADTTVETDLAEGDVAGISERQHFHARSSTYSWRAMRDAHEVDGRRRNRS